ncbi:hypothetical protein [Rufibacter psychrotolerans]|uniref:hypothetical protein n=1 Tax=Rufibacter psychrotolerans TaxID=2812556 RepID=UPI0019685322|nr:hypothetical protein [Rufibacter sp. SYSU D00308]
MKTDREMGSTSGKRPEDHTSPFHLKNRIRGVRSVFGLLLLGLSFGSASGQIRSLNNLQAALQAHQEKNVQEKLFLHLDRPAYACGETMWFKVYNVDGTRHQPLRMSKVAYVEVLDAANKSVLQGKIALQEGSGNGSFVLPATLPSGNYRVRAYTNWMKNFGPEFYFGQPVTIINTFQPLTLKAQKDTAAYAIRFFPEGGQLVNGLPAKVAFKATNSFTGKGAFCQGQVLDQAGNVVASFEPATLGMGHFRFTPTSAGAYTAVVQFAGGQEVRQKLPAVQEQGYTLGLEENSAQQVLFTAAASYQQAEPLYLLGHTRQQVVVAATATLVNGKAQFLVAKDSLPAGITHFTLFNSQQQPVAERLFFTRPTQLLQIEATLGQTQIGPREKVTLDLLTSLLPGQPSAANLSVAVFRQDSLQAAAPADITAYLYLTSDLKGTVEAPASYFKETSPQANEALDHLMLTHGWSRFTWDQVLRPQPASPRFLPEVQGHLIRGKVTHLATGAPAKGIRTYLAAPGKNVRFYTSTSSDSGTVLFDAKDFFGPKEVVVQSNFLQDSTYHFQLDDPFSERHTSARLPLFTLSEQQEGALYWRHLDAQAQNIYFEKHLNRFRAPGHDSLPFYGKPNQRYFLDQYTRFKVMEEVLREYVPGVIVRKRRGNFHFMVPDEQRRQIFGTDPLVLLDGVPVFDLNKIMAFDPLKIQRLDVLTSRYYNGSLVSDGVVSYTTYKGDLAGFPLDARALLQEYEGLQQQREFYAPTYNTQEQKLSRLPDWRNLLYWSPDLKTGAQGKAQTHFYTSDQPGTYVVVVQGLTSGGLPGSKVISFTVKNPL